MMVVNLFGGPGAGKSTTAYGLMYELKRAGFRVEFVPEYAKDLVAGEEWELLKDQRAIMKEQKRRVDLYARISDIVVNESPLLNGIVYTAIDHPDHDPNHYIDAFNLYGNLNFLIVRGNHAYQQAGRYQDEIGARLVDNTVELMLNQYNIPFIPVITQYAVEQSLLEISNRLAVQSKLA